MVPHAGIEPALLSELDFESSASTSSANGAGTEGKLGREYTVRAGGVNRKFRDEPGLSRVLHKGFITQVSARATALCHLQPCLVPLKAGRTRNRSGQTMLRRLYDWTLSLAARPSAEIWLAVIAFVESSVFLVPADVLFLPMALARPEKAWRYALIATVASVLGGIAGWFLGYYAFEALARPILEFYGKLDAFRQLSASVDYTTMLLLLVTSGLAHLPPIKVVTILSGVAHIPLGLFIVSAVLARGARFFALAYLLRRYGAPIRVFIEERLGMIAGIAAAALIALYVAYKLLAH